MASYEDSIDPLSGSANAQGGIGSMVSAGVHRAGAGLGMLGAQVGLPTAGWAQGQAQQAQNATAMAQAGGIPQSWREVQGPVDALKFIAGQGAEMAPQLGSMAAGSLAGGAMAGPPGALAGAAAALYPQQVGENLQEQYETSGGKTNLGTAAGLAVPETAAMMVGPEGRAARMVLGAVDRTGSRIANAALTAGREGAINAGIGAVTAGLTDVNKASVSQQPMDLLSTTQDVLEGAATGAAMGGIVGGVRGIFHTPIPRTPSDAGGDSSRDAAYGSPSAGGNPSVSTTLPTTDKIPAYQRKGVVIPGVNDQDATGAAISGVPPGATQGELDLTGAGPFTPRYDAKGNALPGIVSQDPNATAAAHGPGPFNTVDQAITGLQQLHADLTQQLGQATASGDAAGVATLTAHIKAVEGHLQTLGSQPAAGQRALDFSARAPRTGSTPDGTVLFQDKDAQTQLDEAQQIATSSQPEATPNPNAQIVQPGMAPTQPLARPGQIPTAEQAANARMPAEPAGGRVQMPTATPKPGFQLAGHLTPQFEMPTRPEPAPEAVDHSQQLEMPFPKPGENPLPEQPAKPGEEPPRNTQMQDQMLKVLRQRDWDKAQEVIGNRRAGEMEAARAEQPNAAQWQTQMRVGWKNASEGSLQGFHKAMKTALEAKTPEAAAKAVRTKAGDDTSTTAYHKLDAVHRALTGQSIEEGRINEARENAKPAPAPSGAVEENPLAHEGVPAETTAVAPEAAPTERAGEQAPVGKDETNAPQGGRALSEREQNVQRLTQVLNTTKDPKEFQRAVNELYRESQTFPERSGDLAAHKAEVYLQDPENGITDENLAAAEKAYNEEGMTQKTELGAKRQGLADMFRRNKQAAADKAAVSAAELNEIMKGLPKPPTDPAKLEEHQRAVAESMAKVYGGTADEWYNRMYNKPQRSTGIANPDIGNRNMLPENMRQPGASHTGTSMARYLSQNAKSQVVRLAMRAVMNSGRNLDDVPIHIVHDGDTVPQHVQDEMSTGAEAFTTTGKTPEIWAHGNAADEETMAHEILHAALPDAMNRSNDGGMTSVMNDLKRAMQEAGMFDRPGGKFVFDKMFENANEFTSYGFSSPTFRRLLDELESPGKLSLWDRFKAAVAAIFKSPKTFFDKLLDRPSEGATKPISARMEDALHQMLSPDNPRVAEERARTFHQMGSTPAGTIDVMKQGEKDIWDSLRSMARAGKRFAVASMPTHALSDNFSYRMPALKDVVRALDDRTNAQHVLARKAAAVNDQIKEAYRAAGKSLDRFNSVLEDSQISMLDPRKDEAMRRAQVDLARAKDSYDQVMRKSDATDMEKASARGMMRRAVAAARLADTWKKMTEPEKKAVSMTFDALRESITRRQAVMNEILLKNSDGFHDPIIDKMREDNAPQEEIDKQIVRTYGNVLKVAAEPYAPLRRYGDWVTVASSPEYRAAESAARDAHVKYAGEVASGQVGENTENDMRAADSYLHVLTQDPEHRIVQFHNGSVEASNEADRLRTAHPQMEVQRFQRADYTTRAAGMAGGMLDKIIKAVNDHLPPDLRDNIAQSIREVYVDSLPDNSFDHSMQGREGVAGYSTDFSRASLDTLLRDSFNISSMEHAEQMGSALNEMDDQRRASDDDTMNSIFKEVSKRLQQSTDQGTFRRWEQNIAQVTHLMYLGASPGFLLMNMMQMPMITLPMIMARYGTHGSGELFGRSLPDILKSMNLKKGQLDLENATHLSQEERDMLTTLENQGILNMTALHDAATNAHASNIIDPQNKMEAASKGLQLSKDIANLPAQVVETANRAASALAAYRLAREGRSKFGAMSHGAALDYAAKIVRDSHVDYSASNNPAMFKAPGGRLLFQFKKYWINMLSMVSSNMWDAFGHGKEVKGLRNQLADSGLADDVKASKQEMLNQLLERRYVARRTLAGLYGWHMIHTGAMGMPFAGGGIALANVMRNWYADPEDHADTATDLQNWLAGVLGVEPADTLMHGIWAGVAGAGISQRIGMGDLASPMRINANRTGAAAPAEGAVDNILLSALGPTAGLSMQIAQGIDQMAKGNYLKGVEKLLPKAAGDMLKGAGDIQNGGQVDNKGKMVTPLSQKDAILQALGITPEKVLNAYQARQATADEKSTFEGARKSIVQNYAQALKAGSDVTKAKQAMDEFNQRNPDQHLRITLGEVMKARNEIGKPAKPLNAKEKALNSRVDQGAFTQGQ